MIWAAFILYWCLTPASTLPKIQIPYLDKFVHGGFYIILCILMFYGWKKQAAFLSLYKHILLKIFLCAVAFGLSVELLQEVFTTTRHFELFDVLANSAGAAIGIFSARFFVK